MRNRLLHAVSILLVAGAAFLLVRVVSALQAQPVVATDRLGAMTQYATDVKEHRDWLEQQLAASKAANAELQRQLTGALARCPEPEK
jgi:hypothetical protein